MANSAVLEPHRVRGTSSALIPRAAEAARREGFRTVRSRHAATNNRVLVPKTPGR